MKKANLRNYVPPFTESKKWEFQPFMLTSFGGHAGDAGDDGTIEGKSNNFWDDDSDLSNETKKESKSWEFTPWKDYLW